MKPDLKVIKGDSKAYGIEITKDDEVVDITGWTFRFTVKQSLNDSQANAIIVKVQTTHTDPTNGKSAISLNSDDTDIEVGTYHFDMELETSTGEITTFVKGMFTIIKGVTT